VAVGVLLTPGDKLGVRVEGSFSSSEFESANNSLSSHSWTAGLSTLHYAGAPADLRTYVSPRVTFTRSSGDAGPTTTVTDAWGLSLSFGAQAKLGTRISAYGETGIAYNTSETAVAGAKTTSIAPRSAIGLILFFGK
jgi:opacity protein-like surface antigen